MKASAEKNQRQAPSLKLSRELAKIPIEKYRLVKDGRKWKAIARDRMGLAEFLGKHGDGDGTRIFLSIKTMMRHFGWSHGKVCYLLEDLRKLLLLEDTPNYSSEKHHRTRVRQLNVAAFLAQPTAPLPPKPPKPPRVQDTQGQESNIDAGVQDTGVQDTRPGVQDTTQESKIEGQESKHTLDTTVTTDRHLTDTLTDTQNREAKNASLDFPEWLPADAWNNFVAYRKEIKKPLAAQARELALRKLAELRDAGNDPVAVIEQTILSGWSGFWALKDGRTFNPAATTTQDYLERFKKNMRAAELDEKKKPN